jgi:hypothetical protein
MHYCTRYVFALKCTLHLAGSPISLLKQAVADPSRRKRAYKLTAIYRQYIGGLSAKPRG